ncbi:MAG: DsbA family oxidoreductase [Alphaproteobacteria bacterium]
MRVDIISDTICPWCYIGKRRFERALKSFGDEEPVEIVWWPFQLNPTMPAEGMERRAYMTEKFGSPERAAEIYRQVEAAGRGEDIPFAFDRIAVTPNTLNSHRLIAFAGEHGKQDAVVEVLFRRYFEEGGNIGDTEVLVEAASAAGLPVQEVRALLEGDAGRDEVARSDVAARQLGINGVPCFIVNGRYAVSGAQDPEVFLRVFGLAGSQTESAAD